MVLTAAAGARRTATSLERLASRSHAADALLNIEEDDPELIDQIRALPSTGDIGAATSMFAVVDGVEADIGLVAPRGEGVATSIETGLLVEGRRPDPDRPDEIIVNETTAALIARGAGDEVVVHTLTPEQVAAEAYFPPEGPDLELTIAGVIRDVDDAASRAEGTLYATPAFYETVQGRIDEFATYVVVLLEPGATSEDFERELDGVAGERRIDVFTYAVRSKPARTTVSALALGLAAFAMAAAVAATVIVGQAVARHVATAKDDLVTLRALGVRPATGLRALAATALPVAVVGAVGAGIVAAIGSTTMPIGLARRIEPDRGVDLDGAVLMLGPLLVAVVVIGAGLLGAWFARRVEAPARVRRPSTAVTAVARSGASPAVVNGVGLALDRRTAATTPLPAIGGTIVAVVGAVAVLIFVASLDRLVETPGRWGYAWDLTFDLTSETVEGASRSLAAADEIAAVARFDSGATIVAGESVRANGLTPVHGEIGFALRDGRQPAGPGEAVVGPATAERLGIEIGDEIAVAPPESDSAPADLEVVGIALFPEVDEGDFTDGVGMVGEDFRAHASIPAAFEASQVVARVAHGADPQAVVDRLGPEYQEFSANVLPAPPTDIDTVSSVRTIPRWLLAFVALLGVASLVHGLHTTMTRRRLHLAMLRVMGMTRREIWGCCVVNALTITAVALVVGVPLGIAVGRLTWRAVAGSLDVAPDPLTSILTLVLLSASAALVAVLAATEASRRVGSGVVVAGLAPDQRSVRTDS